VLQQLSLQSVTSIDFTSADNLGIVKALLPTQTILFFGVPALAFAFFAYKNSLQYIGLRPVKNYSYLWIGILATVAGLYFVGLVAQWNKMIPMPQSWIDTEKQYEVLTKSLLHMNGIGDLIFNIIIIGLLPAICEELFFRGCVQNILIQQMGKKNAIIAIIITAAVFGLIHGQMQTVLPRIFLGTVLGLLYYYSNSIYTSIAAHFVNNALQVVVAYFASHNVINSKFTEDTHVPLLYGLMSGAICFALVWMIYKSKQEYVVYTNNPNIHFDFLDNPSQI
jgi:uncharacterized protein